MHGDTITLKGISKDIDLKVTGVADEYINVVISKKAIKSLNMQIQDTKSYPDVIVLNVANAAIECKVEAINDDAVQILIPSTVVSSLKMSFQSQNKQVKTTPVEVEEKSKTVDVSEAGEKTEQKEERVPESKGAEIPEKLAAAEDIRTNPTEKIGMEKSYRLKVKNKERKGEAEELNLSRVGTESEHINKNDAGVDEKPQEEGMETTELDQKQGKDSQSVGNAIEEVAKKEPSPQDMNLGRVEGRILHSGKPLPTCQVKLQMLEKSGLLVKGYRPVEGATELEAVTDGEGAYHFMNVSPGSYKLYWKPPSETAWVRRFKMEPDVKIEPGKLTNPKDIETLKRTLN